MARLNDPPPAAESIDALKRRFVRQNRELARINSNQSVRIRNLENEISRLLSENIGFRERLIKLTNEADRNPGQSTFEYISTLRSHMEAKVADLSNMIKELEKVQIEPRRKSRGGFSQQTSPRRSPDQKNWKNRLTISEVTGSIDNRLPPIVEDKYYPRRTLESDELRDMLEAANALDSPDLGPPPTASWEEDPVTNNSVLGSPTWPLMSVDAGSIQQNSVTNLETRRKRRESTHSSDTANYELSDIQASNFAVRSETDVQSFKVGAKRKLSVRDDGGGAGMEKVEERNKSFYGSSINQQHENEVDTACKAADNVAQNLSILNISQGPPSKSSEQVPKIKQTAHSSAIKPRKALGAKSVNTDPLRSPTKLNRAVLNEKRVGQRSVTHGRSGEQSRQKERPSRGNRIESDDQEQCKAPGTVIDTVPSRLGSPAESSHDTFSPQSSEPLANLPDACDTPPPTDLVAGVSSTDALVATGRATRRARGSVSYVEPSLRDKMRRPTKELVDAVGSDDRPQIVKVQDIKAAPETEKNEIHAVTVKKEPFDEPADWRELPTANNRDNNQPSTEVQATSPHFKKNMAASTKLLPAAVITDRRGRDLSVSNGDQHREEGRPVSSSGPTIAALVAQAQRAKSHDTNHTHTEVRSSKDIFELDGSSPTAPTRTSRRHSSISVNGIPKIASAGAQSSANRSRERRRESIIGAPSCRSEDDAQVRSMKSNDQLKDVGMGRAERAASRRKSMML